jgi:hypothetical protein
MADRSERIAFREVDREGSLGADMTTVWRTSSYSQGNGACLELARTLDRVRDTKHRTGPVLSGDVTALVAAVKADRIHR